MPMPTKTMENPHRQTANGFAAGLAGDVSFTFVIVITVPGYMSPNI